MTSLILSQPTSALAMRHTIKTRPAAHVRFAATLVEADKAKAVKKLLVDIDAAMQAQRSKVGPVRFFQIHYQGPMPYQHGVIGMLSFETPGLPVNTPNNTVTLTIANPNVPTFAFWEIGLDKTTGKLAPLPFESDQPDNAPAFVYRVKKGAKQKPPGRFEQWLNAQLERWCPSTPPEDAGDGEVIISPPLPQYQRKVLPLTPKNQQRAYTMAIDLLTRAHAALTQGDQSHYAAYAGPGNKIS